MKLTWKDVLAALLALFGAVIVFAKLQAYSWWLIGSWKGALGVLAVTGLAILLTNVIELVKLADLSSFGETTLWLITAAVTVAGLIVTTTKADFIFAAIMIGASWLVQLAYHVWGSTHSHRPHYLPVH